MKDTQAKQSDDKVQELELASNPEGFTGPYGSLGTMRGCIWIRFDPDSLARHQGPGKKNKQSSHSGAKSWASSRACWKETKRQPGVQR